MFAVPFGAVDLAALLVAREKLERALIAETGIAKADPRTGRYSVHIDDEEDVDEVAGTAADENEVHGNNVEKEYAATSPTSMADRRARGLKPAGLDRVLQIRMQSLAVRIMIGLVLRLGLARVRCQLLQLGAQWMSRRADAGVAHANEIYVTDENIVKVSCELSEALENAPEIFADAANDESKFSKNGTATTGLNGPYGKMKHAAPPALYIEPRPPMEFEQSAASLKNPRDGSKSKARRFVRSRILQSSIASSSAGSGPGSRQGRSSSGVFERDKAWEQQLRKSRPSSPARASPKARSSTHASTQRRRARTPTARDIQGQRSDDGVDADVRAAVRRALTPMSAKTLPVNSGRASPQRSRQQLAHSSRGSQSQANSPAAARRRMSQAYGNFYSDQNARKQIQRAKQIQSNAESLLSSRGSRGQHVV